MKQRYLAKTQRLGSFILAPLVLVLLHGCTTPKPVEPEPEPEPPDATEVIEAADLFEQGKVQEAVIAAIEITRKNPEARGLTALQARLSAKLAEERMAAAEKLAASTATAATADAERFSAMPETYRTMRHVVGETGSLKSVPAAMQQALYSPISVNLQNADINAFVAQFAQSTNINIVADSALSESEAAITVKAENTPLIEILDYVGRNLGATFSVGENIIWATARDEKSETALPMETRVYRLRKGVTGAELGKSVQGLTPFKGAQSSRDSTRSEPQQPKEQETKEGSIAVVDTIAKFVAQPEGADILYNEKAHVLIVKNTRENLTKTEDIIDALDIRPLQILIEARFISTKVTDLSDLGIDWLLDSRGPARFIGGSPGGTGATDADGNPVPPADYGTQAADNWLRGGTLATPVRPDVLTAASDSRGLGLAYQAVMGNTALQATLRALKEDGSSRAIFVPRITTLNNKEATVRVGEDTTYYDDVDVQSTSSTGYGASSGYRDVQMRYNTPARLETGCTLMVTPSVGADLSTINLLLRPEISDVKEWNEYILSTVTYQGESGKAETPKIRIPTVTRQYLETEAVVRSGETVVLGGLVRTRNEERETRTPWLSDLPLLGYLFRHEKTETTSENILIFVTATLISDTGEGLIPLNEIEGYGQPLPAGGRPLVSPR